jgi:hypothetical protein
MGSRVRRLVSAWGALLVWAACSFAQAGQEEKKGGPWGKPLGRCGRRSVALLVDPALLTSIRKELDRFKEDLCRSGYGTVEHGSGFGDAGAIRAYLRGLYQERGGSLAGAILIGRMPHAYQWVNLAPVNPAFSPSAQEVISFQYYADLDGTFTQSPAYSSPGGHAFSYDGHDGTVSWEIWVGVLPRYKGDLKQTAAAVRRYFDKNHAYRSGTPARPNVFLQVSEHFTANTLADHQSILAGMQTGPYSWTPYSNSAGARLYFDSPPGGLSVQQGYADLRAGLADITVTDTHGTWATSGQLTIATVESSPVGTVFFWSNGCANGDLDHADNFLTSVLYSPTSVVLVAKGTTNDSGGMGNNGNGFFGHNVATALRAGASFGDAVLGHVNVPLVAPWSGDREYHFASTVILGDPTLLRLSAGGPDLVPRGRPGLPGAPGFCQAVRTGPSQGKLIVTVTNRGNATAKASTARVKFSNGASYSLPTPALAPGGSVDLPPLGIPAACFQPDCSFKVRVDSQDQVLESDEGNNAADGTCLG